MTPDTIYHLTDMQNIPGIIVNGILSRAELTKQNLLTQITDIGNPDIVQKRKELGILNRVPFHLFPDTAFDYVAQTENPEIDFVYLTIPLEYAKQQHWGYIPCHPLHYGNNTIYDCFAYDFNNAETNNGPRLWWVIYRHRLEWDEYKQIYMAEVLGPNIVNFNEIGSILVKNNQIRDILQNVANTYNLRLPQINVRANLFWNQ